MFAPAAVKAFPVPDEHRNIGAGKPFTDRLPQKLQAVAVKVLKIRVDDLKIEADRFKLLQRVFTPA
jgi:hypothetical protein